MNWKKFCINWIKIVVTLVVLLLVFTYVTDFLSILKLPGSGIVKVFKVNQEKYFSVLKPYQYIYSCPDTVFIGNSRVLVGWSPDLPVDHDCSVYNLACPSMTLSEIKEYLQFACKVHVPKEVIIGLDITHFSKYVECNPEEKKKLKVLARVSDSVLLQMYALKDNFQLNRGIFSLLRKGIKEQTYGDVCYQGWDRYRGMRQIPVGQVKKDLENVRNQSDMQHSGTQHLDLESWKCLCDIYEMLRSQNVKAIVFFNPLMKEYNDVLLSSWNDEEVLSIKQRVANLFGKVYDFNIGSKFTNDYKLYSDISHYNAEMGRLMKQAIWKDDLSLGIMQILYSHDRDSEHSRRF